MARKQSSVEELVSLVFAMGRVVRENIWNKDRGPCGSLLGLEVLQYVEEAGQPHMREIAKKFHVTPPAATIMINGLVQGKMLRRILDPADRRSVRVGLTAPGRKVLVRGMAKKTNAFKKVFAVLTPAERTRFAAMLKKIIKNNS